MGASSSSSGTEAGAGGGSVEVARTQQQQAVDMDKALNSVAAQVYDNVHQQVGAMQQEQLASSVALAKEIHARMQPAVAATGDSSANPLCRAEADAVIACLNANKKTPLLCASLVDSMAVCAAAAASK